MFNISAFADEIDPDPRKQVDVLKACDVRFIEFRSIRLTNVVKLPDEQVREFKALLDGEGIKLSAVGSPVGKVPIDDPFEPHLDTFKRAVEVAQLFGTPNIRVFSYYPPKGGPEDGWQAGRRDEVIRRMGVKAEMAQAAGLRLIHENEHRIYGDSPERVADVLGAVNSPAMKAAYDAANYVVCGHDPYAAWQATRGQTVHFHIKDWKGGAEVGSLAGEGDGQWGRVIADAVAAGYDGFATMEPHLLQGGPTGGVTGPELFPKAVEAFRALLKTAGGTEA